MTTRVLPGIPAYAPTAVPCGPFRYITSIFFLGQSLYWFSAAIVKNFSLPDSYDELETLALTGSDCSLKILIGERDRSMIFMETVGVIRKVLIGISVTGPAAGCMGPTLHKRWKSCNTEWLKKDLSVLKPMIV